jgi:hypothetical protein
MRQRKETFFRDNACVATARSSARRAPTCKCSRWGTRKLTPEKAAASRRTPKPLRAKPARGAAGKRRPHQRIGPALDASRSEDRRLQMRSQGKTGDSACRRRKACLPQAGRPYKESVAAGRGAFSCAKGHCRISRVQIRNARRPRAISRSPHLRMGPVCQKSQAQASMVRTAGSG